MNSPTFNLAQLAVRPNWYDHLDKIEAMLRGQDHADHIRREAGWETDEGGWYAPCGMHEDDWACEGHPFPEDPEYAEWASAYYHHEALDSAPITP